MSKYDSLIKLTESAFRAEEFAEKLNDAVNNCLDGLAEFLDEDKIARPAIVEGYKPVDFRENIKDKSK